MQSMASSPFYLLLVVSLNFPSSDTKPISLLDNGKRMASTDFTAEIEEISKREFQTVHGRILAVNMAHLRKKRQTAGNETDGENTFKEIVKINKENISDFYQGDIKLDPELEDYIRNGGNTRNAIREKKRIWNTRIIPYYIPSYMSHIRSNVDKAIQEFHSKTCIRFQYYNRAVHGYNYIRFGNSDGCSSKVGKHYAESTYQGISLGDGCNNVPTIVHEMMHAIGFFHEQSRSDRDKYVKIYWENILPGFSDQFDKYSWRTLDDLGVSYDYQSVMHYDRKAFTKNGKPTIVAVGNENMEFGAPNHLLSTRDAVEINALYNCRKLTNGWSSWSGWTPCDEKCYRSRERFCINSGNQQACGGNVNVYGVDKQRVKCPSSICPAPIDGHWGRWSDWRPCSKTCNDGIKTRFRKCDNPAPGHNGKPCPGSANDEAMCILKRCNLDNDDADFENGRLGMWSNSRSDNLNWRFHRSYTQTVNTGPSADHTNGLGYYLYVESSGTSPGNRAELVSPWRSRLPGGQCFKFYYTMYGKNMGSLAVKLTLSDGRNWYIFYKQGDQGKDWKKGIGSIDPPTGLRYRLSIIGKMGRETGYADIAIDDVYIDPGLCSCQDGYHTCHIWAAKGDCTKNRAWMTKNCKRSCRVCVTTTAKTTPRRPVNPKPTIVGQVCTDSAGHESNCPYWAKTGQCDKNPDWMLVNCKKSCSSKIKDKQSDCPAWANLGECTKNPSWMLPNCKLSCMRIKC